VCWFTKKRKKLRWGPVPHASAHNKWLIVGTAHSLLQNCKEIRKKAKFLATGSFQSHFHLAHFGLLFVSYFLFRLCPLFIKVIHKVTLFWSLVWPSSPCFIPNLSVTFIKWVKLVSLHKIGFFCFVFFLGSGNQWIVTDGPSVARKKKRVLATSQKFVNSTFQHQTGCMILLSDHSSCYQHK
jgi:hypothetical protein